MALLEVLELCSPHCAFVELWPQLRGVSHGVRRFAAEDLWRWKACTMERHIAIELERATDRLMCEGGTGLGRDKARQLLGNMMVLQGTAQLIFQIKGRGWTGRPASMEDIIAGTSHHFDRAVLEDLCPLPGPPLSPLGFHHLGECLLRAGEMRIFVASLTETWSDTDERSQSMAEAYLRLIRHRWAWPRLAFARDEGGDHI